MIVFDFADAGYLIRMDGFRGYVQQISISNFLKRTLEERGNEPVVVVTHHVPSDIIFISEGLKFHISRMAYFQNRLEVSLLMTIGR